MPIKPKDVATSIDKHHEALVQATRVMGHIDSVLANYYKTLRHRPEIELGMCRFRFYFTGTIQEDVQDVLDRAYRDNSWSGVKLQGWLTKDFVQLPQHKADEIVDIGGHASQVFEVELTCTSTMMY